jgi:ribosomal protein S21
MPTVRVRDNENFELSLRRFKRLAAAVKRYQKKILRETMALERDRQPIGTSRKDAA